MAEVIDDLDVPSDNQDDKQQNDATPAPAPAAAAPAPAPADDLPEKYRGKTPSEIARMHQELEQRLGHQGEELGLLRRLADEFVRPQAPAKKDTKADSTESTTDDDAQFFINPKAAIERAVENHPLVKELRSTTAKSQQERAQEAFRAKHPDYMDVLKEPEFREWVTKSQVRVGLLIRADQQYDAVAGDELLSTWKEIKALKAPKPQDPPPADNGASADEAARQEAVRAGKVPAGNANPGNNNGGKKIYRRADLIHMKIHDPARYEAMADEITAAYLENRVK